MKTEFNDFREHFHLHLLPKPFKKLLGVFTIVLSLGVGLGNVYVWQTTQLTPTGTVERYNGSSLGEEADEFEIPTHYAKPMGELLITTHNHVNSLSLIFVCMGLLFLGSSVVKGQWKTFIAIEPMVSIVTTFGGLWAMRYLHPAFVYLVMVSAILMYVCFYVMAICVLYDLFVKKAPSPSN